MDCVCSFSPGVSFVFVVIRILADKELPGKSPSSALEPGARDTKFRLSVSIHFFKTFLGEGAYRTWRDKLRRVRHGHLHGYLFRSGKTDQLRAQCWSSRGTLRRATSVVIPRLAKRAEGPHAQAADHTKLQSVIASPRGRSLAVFAGSG
jgi:hypothetical protein